MVARYARRLPGILQTRMEANPIVLDDTAGDVVVVVVEGEHDIYTAPTLRERLEEALERGGGIVVDLTAATFVDSSVLGALLDARRRALEASQGFVVCVGDTVEPGVQRILDSINTPADVRNGRMDVLATNRLGRALFADAYGASNVSGESGFNVARYLFLDPASRDFYLQWDEVARVTVASLRAEAGRNPYDRALTDLVGELSTRSEEFRTWWAVHDVKRHSTATKRFHHPVAGEFELTGEALELPGDPGLRLITYTVEPASPSEQALGFLASWSSRDAAPEAAQPATRSDVAPRPDQRGHA